MPHAASEVHRRIPAAAWLVAAALSFLLVSCSDDVVVDRVFNNLGDSTTVTYHLSEGATEIATPTPIVLDTLLQINGHLQLGDSSFVWATGGATTAFIDSSGEVVGRVAGTVVLAHRDTVLLADRQMYRSNGEVNSYINLRPLTLEPQIDSILCYNFEVVRDTPVVVAKKLDGTVETFDLTLKPRRNHKDTLRCKGGI